MTVPTPDLRSDAEAPLNSLGFAKPPAQTRVVVAMSGGVDSSVVAAHLAAQGDRWALALDASKLLAAVNQTLVPMSHPLQAGDEVAFFPPVTGG